MALGLFDELTALLSLLEAEGVRYAVAGAVALAIHGVPRATADIDLLVLPEELERARSVARRRGFTLEALPMKFSDGMEVRRLNKVEAEESLTLDFLLVDANLDSVWQTRVRVPAEHGDVWVVSREGLIRMKTWAGRDQDLADVKRLHELDR